MDRDCRDKHEIVCSAACDEGSKMQKMIESSASSSSSPYVFYGISSSGYLPSCHPPQSARQYKILSPFLIMIWILTWCPMIAALNLNGLSVFDTLSIPEMEMGALRDLYEATSGPDWTIFGVPWNFTGAHNPCEEGWEGVQCTCQRPDVDEMLPYIPYAPPEYVYYYDDGSGVLGAPCHVSKLSLGFTRLQGTLPTSLGNLVYLTRLHLEQNHISGSIPPTFASLLNVQYLMLLCNSLTGSIPTSLGHLTAVQIFAVYLTSLTGTIPTSLGRIDRMYTLQLYHNSLTGSIPPALGSLTQLQQLALNGNSLSGQIPIPLGALAALETLSLSLNSFTGPIPTSLGHLTNIQNFFLHINSFTGPIPTSLGYLTSIRNLQLHTNSLTGSIPSTLGFLTKMEVLGLPSNYLSGSIPTSFGNCSNLVLLQLNDNFLSGKIEGIFQPQLQRQIVVIDVNGNRLTGPIPTALSQMPNLVTIAMVENCLSGTLPSEMCSATSLQVLALDGLHTAPSCQHRFFPESTSIATYSLQPSQSMRGSIPPCLYNMPNLTTLHLSGNGLTGTIGDVEPTSNNALMDLSLGHNILTGSIPYWMQGRQWDNLDLGYNRLSGTLASSFAVLGANSSLALNVNRLSGNIPSVLKGAHTITILDGNLFGCATNRKSLPSNDPDAHAYQCGSNEVNFALMAWAAALCCCAMMHIFYFGLRTSQFQWNRIISHSFSTALASSRTIAVAFAGVYFFVLMPLYGALSVYYRTHSFVYTWAVSASYLSGSAASAAIILFWSFLAVVICVGAAHAPDPSAKYAKIADVMESNSSDTTTMLILVSFVVVNFVVIGGVNTAYVLLVTTGTLDSANAITVVEVSLGALKAGWNGFVLPSCFEYFEYLESKKSAIDSRAVAKGAKGQLVLSTLVVSNSILLPCIVAALVDPNCFNGVIFQAPPIDVSYAYSYCSQFALSHCVQLAYQFVATSYSPPFIYNYQCTSALLTDYASVYVYSITFSSLLVPIALKLYSGINNVKAIPGVNDVKAGFNEVKFSARLMNLFAIAVTFGMVFPLLFIVVLVAVFVETTSAEAQMARFVELAGSEALARERKAEVDAADVTLMKSLISGLWLLVPLSASFNAFFLFDILGNEVGWKVSLGGLFAVMIVLPSMMWGGYKLWCKKGVVLGDKKIVSKGKAKDDNAMDVEMVVLPN